MVVCVLKTPTGRGETGSPLSEEEGRGAGPLPHNAGEYFGGGGTGPTPHILEDFGPFLKRGFELRAVWRRRMCIPQSGGKWGRLRTFKKAGGACTSRTQVAPRPSKGQGRA